MQHFLDFVNTDMMLSPNLLYECVKPDDFTDVHLSPGSLLRLKVLLVHHVIRLS